MICPHCGGVIDIEPLSHKLLLHSVFDDATHSIVVDRRWPLYLPAAQWKVLTALRERFERLTPLDFLVQIASETASKDAVRVLIVHLRKTLARTPFAIVARWKEGYGLFWAKDVVVEPYNGALTNAKTWRLRSDSVQTP